jgi:hypothetical protein
MNKRTTKLFSALLPAALLPAALLLGSCAQPAPELGLALPGSLRLGELADEDKARLRATVEIEGLLVESPLQIADDLSEVTGSFTLTGIEEETSADFTLRLWLEPVIAELGEQVLLARATGSADITPNEDTELTPTDIGSGEVFDTCGGPDGACELALDLNRNGRPNLEDLVDGIEPTPPPPFLDVAPSTAVPLGHPPGHVRAPGDRRREHLVVARDGDRASGGRAGRDPLALRQRRGRHRARSGHA